MTISVSIRKRTAETRSVVLGLEAVSSYFWGEFQSDRVFGVDELGFLDDLAAGGAAEQRCRGNKDDKPFHKNTPYC